MTKNVMSFDKLGKADGEKASVIHTIADWGTPFRRVSKILTITNGKRYRNDSRF
jgi:hypothetical protein